MVLLNQDTVSMPSKVVKGRSLSAQLGEFFADLVFDDLPRQVVVQTKRCLIDSVGIAFASGAFDFSRRALLALTEDCKNGNYPILGMSDRLTRRDAALMNGLLIHGLDYDDTHVPGIVHASASALPTALAVGIERHLSGRELLCGYAIALEVDARLGTVAGGAFHQVGFHPTGLIGAFGAAVAAGRLSGLSAYSIMQAQGIVGSMAAGSLEFLESGAWTKRLHPGWAASSGLLAASLAAQGFVGPEFIYEGRFGLYRSHLGSDWSGDYEEIIAGLGEHWEIERIALKPYPSCHFTHAFADAALSLVSDGLKPEDIDHIECLIAPGEVGVVCEPAEAKRAPKNEYEAKFSLPFVVAACFARGQFGLKELSEDTLFDPIVQRLAGKVSYRTDPDSDFPRHYSGEVVVTTTDGHTLRAREQINRGAEERPLDDHAISKKFRENICLTRSGIIADQIGEALDTVENCHDVAELAEVLRG